VAGSYSLFCITLFFLDIIANKSMAQSQHYKQVFCGLRGCNETETLWPRQALEFTVSMVNVATRGRKPCHSEDMAHFLWHRWSAW